MYADAAYLMMKSNKYYKRSGDAKKAAKAKPKPANEQEESIV